MSEDNRLITERKQKIEDWKSLGFVPYAKDFERTHTAVTATEFCENEKLAEAPEII